MIKFLIALFLLVLVSGCASGDWWCIPSNMPVLF